jgi:hypothetical protein
MGAVRVSGGELRPGKEAGGGMRLPPGRRRAGFGPAAGKKAGGIWGRAARLPVDKEETRGRSREVHIGVGGFSQAEQQVVGGSARSGKGGSRIVLLYIYTSM